jgi:predicted nucleic acid-binding protein
MEDLVIDSSVAVKWVIEEDDSDTAQLILDQYKDRKIVLQAPALIHAEFGNIIWKKQIYQGLSTADANSAIKTFQQLSFILAPTSASFNDAFKIAVKYQRTFYDSLYLALSEREKCRFVTADEKLYNSVKSAFPNTVLLANWK